MTTLVTNSSNLNSLKDAISKAKKEICISSAWIRSETLKKIISEDIKNKLKSKEISLKILIRLGEKVDLEITDTGVFSIAEEYTAEIRYHKELHAKVYIVDYNYAMVASSNLTAGGFGDEYKPGNNPEAGIVLTEKNSVKEMKEWFNELWDTGHIIHDNLLGFVLTPASNMNFTLLGIKELEFNKYIEVKVNIQESIIGKIKLSQKVSQIYYQNPLESTEFNQKTNELYRDFAGLIFENKSYQNAKALSMSIGKQPQLNIAEIEIISRILISKGQDGKINKIITEINKVPPDIASEVYEADKETLEKLYYNEYCSPAVMNSNPDIRVGFDPKKLTTTHMAIMGSTGSGKSYFAKTLITGYLFKWFCEKQKGRILIFDPHGEYAKDFTSGEFKDFKQKNFEIIDIGNKPDLKARVVHDVEDLQEICDIASLNKDERQFLQSAIDNSNDERELIKYIEDKNVSSGNKIDFNDPGFIQIKKSIEDNIVSYLKPLQEVATTIIKIENINTEPQLKANVRDALIHQKATQLYNDLNAESKDRIMRQILLKHFYSAIEQYFEKETRILTDSTLDKIKEAADKGLFRLKAFDVLNQFKDNKIFIINLASIHDDDIRYELTANIIRQIFNQKKENLTEQNTLFVVEEAHNFAPEGAGKGNPASKILQKIASEGRKFSLGLIIITQRPAYVSKSVLA
ncbi:MAG: DUF87 domain-containing protein [Nitrospirae bacterium]|nr:DUF87 domain-containing protein [Nitrospirota bacterium]